VDQENLGEKRPRRDSDEEASDRRLHFDRPLALAALRVEGREEILPGDPGRV
jgi:hypothetical protein